MKKRILAVLVALSLMIGICVPSFAANETMPYELIDSHLHYQDFTQQSEGFAVLAEAMQKINVKGAVIFGMPMTKMWDENAPKSPTYYMSNDSRTYYYSGTDFILAEALKQYKEKNKDSSVTFYPFACGVNTNDLYAYEQLEQLLKLYPDTFFGIGEIMLRHDDLTSLTYGEPPRPNSKGMLRIYDLASEKKLPVLIHHNITASYDKGTLYLNELEQSLEYAKGKNVKVIWAHVGVSRRVETPSPLLLETAQKLIEKYPNLYIDISWLVFDDYINKNTKEMEAWADLIIKKEDHFMIGSDKVGKWGQDGADYQKEITKYIPLLDTIINVASAAGRTDGEVICQKLCSENILNVIKKAK